MGTTPGAVLARKSRGMLVFIAAVFTFASALLAYDGLVKQRVRITQGPKWGPPTRIWTFTGPEAVRIGFGGIAVGLAGMVWVMNALLLARTSRSWRLRVGLALGLLAVAVVLFFPPWRLTGTGVIAAFYGFLVPALAGVAGRTGGRIFTGLVGGVILSALLGGADWPHGMMPGLLAFLFLGSHLGFLIHAPFREALTG